MMYRIFKDFARRSFKNFCKNTKILIFTDKKNTNIYSDNFQYYSCYISYLINTLEKKKNKFT